MTHICNFFSIAAVFIAGGFMFTDYEILETHLMSLFGSLDKDKCIKCQVFVTRSIDVIRLVKEALGDDRFETFKKKLQLQEGREIIPTDNPQEMECIPSHLFFKALAETCQEKEPVYC
jgi:hypothetical protein